VALAPVLAFSQSAFASYFVFCILYFRYHSLIDCGVVRTSERFLTSDVSRFAAVDTLTGRYTYVCDIHRVVCLLSVVCCPLSAVCCRLGMQCLCDYKSSAFAANRAWTSATQIYSRLACVDCTVAVHERATATTESRATGASSSALTQSTLSTRRHFLRKSFQPSPTKRSVHSCSRTGVCSPWPSMTMQPSWL